MIVEYRSLFAQSRQDSSLIYDLSRYDETNGTERYAYCAFLDRDRYAISQTCNFRSRDFNGRLARDDTFRLVVSKQGASSFPSARVTRITVAPGSSLAPPGGRYLPRRAALSFHRPSTLPFFLKPFNYRGHSASSYVRLLLRARHHSPARARARARSCDGDAPFPARNAAPEVAVCVYLLPCRGRSNAALPSYPREE